MVRKNYFHRTRISENSGVYHEYLHLETAEYCVRIHGWKEWYLDVRSIDDMLYHIEEPPRKMGERVVLTSKISGTTLETRYSHSFCVYRWIERLLSTRDRNRELWNLEVALSNDEWGSLDMPIGSLHELDGGHFYDRLRQKTQRL